MFDAERDTRFMIAQPASTAPDRPARTGLPTPIRRGALVIAGVCVGILVSVFFSIAASWPTTSVGRQWIQPSTVTYSDQSKHHATTVRKSTLLSFLGVSDERISVVLGRDPGGGYGHEVVVDATSSSAQPSAVEWTEAGATLTYPSGHRVFVPAAKFIGGR